MGKLTSKDLFSGVVGVKNDVRYVSVLISSFALRLSIANFSGFAYCDFNDYIRDVIADTTWALYLSLSNDGLANTGR